MAKLINENPPLVDVVIGEDSTDLNFQMTNPKGWITFDVRMESNVEDPGVRSGIRDSFVKAVAYLTGLESANHQGELVKYLKNDLTSIQDLDMPAHGKDMLKKLNAKYLKKIVKKCADIPSPASKSADPVPLALYVAVPLTGQDYYCIGDLGELYCYHFFGLKEPVGTGGLLSVSYGAETCPICLVCVGPAKD